MDLILWRHGEAEAAKGGLPDAERRLTERGLKQSKQAAEWLHQQRLHKPIVLCSPARRARQTAHCLDLPVKVESRLGIGTRVADLLSAAEWPDYAGAVVLVGHQPALGRLAALLLSGTEADWTIKKGGVWCFTNRVRQDETQTVLRAVFSP